MYGDSDKVLGLICVNDATGKTIFSQTITSDRPSVWADFKDAYGAKTVEKFPWPIVFIPEENAAWTRAKPLSCLFQATKGLLRNMWGTDLDHDDQDFFDHHPLAGVDGVSLPNTLRVVQEIIDPYGFRISRVHLMPGTPIHGDLAQWADVLGLNPIALGDHATSNEMFANLTGQDPAVVDKTYNMEYTERKIRPCILCAVKPMSATSTTGENLGHAEYVGARAKRSGYEPTMQIRVDRGNFVHWFKEPAFPEVEDVGGVELSLWSCKAPDGTSMASWYNRKNQGNFHQGSSKGITSDRGSTYLHLLGDGNFECYICFEKKNKDVRVGANLCKGCWNDLWKRFVCPTCEASMVHCKLTGLKMLEHNVENGPWLLRVNCPKCGEPVELKVEKGSLPYNIVQAIRAIKVVK